VRKTIERVCEKDQSTCHFKWDRLYIQVNMCSAICLEKERHGEREQRKSNRVCV